MTGGLIEIVTYGSQDLYLTGTPEITFFKVVYRRYTNFSMESIRVNFDDPVGFGSFSTLTIPRTGDLIHKMYLEVLLPAIDLRRSPCLDVSRDDVDRAIRNYKIVTDFMKINRRAYVGAFEIVQAENNCNLNEMIKIVNQAFNKHHSTIVQEFKTLLEGSNLVPFMYEEISMKQIMDNFSSDRSLDTIFKAMSIGIDKSIRLQGLFFDIMSAAKRKYCDEINENVKFAWVDRIGHALLDEIEIRIGGYKIDRQYGDWINIWYELTARRNLQDVYFKMIGNVPELTDFNRCPKPRYLLQIPMQFWFNRFNGLSLPLVALQYHDVTYHVKFRKMEEVSYIERGERIFIPESNNRLFLDEVSTECGINIEAKLMIDYIYLDSTERRRFAQSSHEYLIDQLQRFDVSNVTQPTRQIELNNFVYPSKELIWIAQKRRYMLNIDGSTKTRFDNYSLTDCNRGPLIKYSSLDFHSFTRVPRFNYSYFNYVQPYQCHYTTPSDGINVYSFALFPEEFQPSGSANLSRLSRILLTVEFDPCLCPQGLDPEPLDVRVYTRSYNVLRFFSGVSGLAFTY